MIGKLFETADVGHSQNYVLHDATIIKYDVTVATLNTAFVFRMQTFNLFSRYQTKLLSQFPPGSPGTIYYLPVSALFNPFITWIIQLSQTLKC